MTLGAFPQRTAHVFTRFGYLRALDHQQHAEPGGSAGNAEQPEFLGVRVLGVTTYPESEFWKLSRLLTSPNPNQCCCHAMHAWD